VDYYLDSADPQAPGVLRRSLMQHLRRHAEDPQSVWQAEIVIEELVSNAVRHANGPVWVSLHWASPEPVLTVIDLGDDFDIPGDLPDPMAESGRGLFLVAHLAPELSVAAKRAGGKRVSARLAVRRRAEASIDPPPASPYPLPALDEASPGSGFSREVFLRAMVVHLAQAVEHMDGPAAAETVVAQVAADIGAQMEAEYRRARDIVGRMTPDQLADCYVRLKAAIDGDFYVIEATEDRIVLGNRRCPFGPAVRRAPELCWLTTSVFGGIAAHNFGDATVVLEERIAVGDPGCRVVVHLGDAPEEAQHAGHRYRGRRHAGRPVERADIDGGRGGGVSADDDDH
jgi:anti-sigma regulatory factor (Ser/Thr protein kinase)